MVIDPQILADLSLIIHRRVLVLFALEIDDGFDVVGFESAFEHSRRELPGTINLVGHNDAETLGEEVVFEMVVDSSGGDQSHHDYQYDPDSTTPSGWSL